MMVVFYDGIDIREGLERVSGCRSGGGGSREGFETGGRGVERVVQGSLQCNELSPVTEDPDPVHKWYFKQSFFVRFLRSIECFVQTKDDEKRFLRRVLSRQLFNGNLFINAQTT